MFPHNENKRSEIHLLHHFSISQRSGPQHTGNGRRTAPRWLGSKQGAAPRRPRGGPTHPPRRGTPRSPFWCSSRTSFAVPPGRLSLGLAAGAAGQEQSEPRAARPSSPFPCLLTPAGRADLPPAANAAPGAGWSHRAPHASVPRRESGALRPPRGSAGTTEAMGERTGPRAAERSAVPGREASRSRRGTEPPQRRAAGSLLLAASPPPRAAGLIVDLSLVT